MQTLKAIIVDDNKIYRQSLKMALGRSPEIRGIEIDEAANGLFFLKLLESSTPSFVLMDIHMPLMDGIQATKQALQKFPKLKIIAISSYNDYHSIKEMKKAGAKAFLSKDTDKRILIDTIIQVLKENQSFVLKI